jgi:hypothetical protein
MTSYFTRPKVPGPFQTCPRLVKLRVVRDLEVSAPRNATDNESSDAVSDVTMKCSV